MVFIFYIISNLFDSWIIDNVVNAFKESLIFRYTFISGLFIYTGFENNFRNSIKESSKRENFYRSPQKWIKDLVAHFKSSDSMANKISAICRRASIAIFKPNLISIFVIVIFCNFILNNFTYIFSRTDFYSSSNYQKAATHFKSGRFDEAAVGFSKITQFEDSTDYLTKIYNMNFDDNGEMSNRTILLGNYDMDNDESNENERILWDVLEANNGRLVLASHYVIGFKSLGNIIGTEGWKDSYLRKWLNEEFYNKAFNSNEKELILKTEIESVASQKKIKTSDYVYLLSVSEAQKYFQNDSLRKRKVQFFNALNVNSFINGTSTWLRDSGEIFRFSYIDPYGEVVSSGDAQIKQLGVRPVINVSVN